LAKLPGKEEREAGKEKDAKIVKKIKELNVAHLFWGYRKIWTWLKRRERIEINQKRVRRIMKEHGLITSQRVFKAKRTP